MAKMTTMTIKATVATGRNAGILEQQLESFSGLLPGVLTALECLELRNDTQRWILHLLLSGYPLHLRLCLDSHSALFLYWIWFIWRILILRHNAMGYGFRW